MRLFAKMVPVPILAGSLVAGCGGNGTGVEDNRPPDLTGTYSLTSFSSSLVTGGATVTPPAVSGRLSLAQSSVGGAQATGTFSLEVSVPDGQGGINDVTDQGTYTVRTDGTWEQAGQLYQGTGTFTLASDVLTVVVSQPATAASTSVWQRQ